MSWYIIAVVVVIVTQMNMTLLLMLLCVMLGRTVSASVAHVSQSAEVDGCRA